MTDTGPITLAFAGSGEITPANAADLLNDWLGFGEEDHEGYYLPSDRDISLIFPVTADHLSDGLKTLVEWSGKADLPFVAVTDESKSRAITKILDVADETHKVANVTAKVISLLEEAEGEKYLVLLWGEEGTEPSEGAELLLDAAADAGIAAKDLTAGLDDISFGPDTAEPVVEPVVEPEPEPVVEEAPKRRRGRKAEKEQVVVEKPLEEAPVVEEAKPEGPTEGEKHAAALKAEAVANRQAAIDKVNADNEAKKKAAEEKADLPHDRQTKPLHTAQASDLHNRFAFHPATTAEKKGEHGSVRDAALVFATFLDSALPNGREKSLALTKLEEAMFWGNAAIARNSPSEATQATETPATPGEPSQGVQTAEEPTEAPRRGRGRPRADGTPAQPRTEDDMKVAVLKTEDGGYRKRGRGRPRKGEEVVMVTPDELANLTLEED